MLGINDLWIGLAYILCVLSTIACVVYGVYNWNKGADSELQEIDEENKWETEEKKIEANL